MEKIAIIAIAYNRVRSLDRLLVSLSAAYYGDEQVPLIISIDKSDTDEVERYADNYAWSAGPKKVVRHERNLGLKAHILSQGRWLDEYDAVVILEDDVVVARDFWNYVRQTVTRYGDNDEVAGISLYSFAVNYHVRRPFTPLRTSDDVYFMNCASSWGQVWMRRQWRCFEAWLKAHADFTYSPALPLSILSWKAQSWLKYHTRYCIEENKYFVFPYISRSTNFSDLGMHVDVRNSLYQVPLMQGRSGVLRLPEKVSDGVAYDGFFENKALYGVLGIDETECCLDLNSCNGNRVGKRYWLTTGRHPYAVKRSYALMRRPVESNVLENCEGCGIYLYDTHVPAVSPRGRRNAAVPYAFNVVNMFLLVREYGFANIMCDFWGVVCEKVAQMIKKILMSGKSRK